MTEIMTGLHMSPLEILALSGAVSLVVARWLPPAARRVVTIAAGSGFVLSAIALSVVGIRWQMLPVLAGAAFALPFAVAPVLRRRPGRSAWRARWWLALPGSVLCLGLIATGPVAAWACPVPVFPEPTGHFAVGTRVMQWTDPNRPETATAEPGDRRTVAVQLWYPAGTSPAGAQQAQYLGRTRQEARTVSDALARYAGLPGFLVDGVPRAHTHSVFDAPVADTGGRFPVVLFSPGLGGVRTQNTAWAEELAGNGYVVAAVDHPYDSAALQAARQDRRFATVINMDGYPRDPDARPFDQPVLALTQAIGPATDPRYIPRLTEVLKLSTATSYRLTIPGAAHLTFTDAPLYLPPVPSIVGSLGRTESPRVVAETTLAFLDTTLRHKPGDLSGILSAYGDLSVYRPGNRR